MLCLYVDDILIFGSDMHVTNNTRKFLRNKFDMKDLGPVDVILGIKVTRDGDLIALTQSHYIGKLLKKFNYYDVSPLSVLLDPTFGF